MISIETAFELLLQSVRPSKSEVVELCNSVGRTLTDPISADVDSPPHRKSIMDGFAVRSADIGGSQRKFKVVETIVAGGWPTRAVQSGEASRIMTGAPLPDGADAIVMVELSRVEQNSEGEFVSFLVNDLPSGKNMINQAQNFRTGEVLFPVGHRICPIDIGLLAEAGAARVEVSRRPTIAILPTGNELVDSYQVPERGQIRNSNGPMLAAMASELGLKTTLLPTSRDSADELKGRIAEGLQHDLLLLTGGVSEGLLDLVPATLKGLGVREVFHKVKIKPGKPIWFGVREESENEDSTAKKKVCYVFGLPGNPVSSLVGFHLFVRTAIRCLEMPSASVKHRKEFVGQDDSPLPRSILAELSCDFEARGDRPTYWPGRILKNHDSKRLVQSLPWGGSSDLRSITKADGLILFPENSGVTAAGSTVPFYPW